jgi:hypothetical protein
LRNFKEMVDFLITVLKCFFILLVLGMFLPRIVDFILYKLINKYNNYDNYLFVNSVLKSNYNVISGYGNCFRSLLKYIFSGRII